MDAGANAPSSCHHPAHFSACSRALPPAAPWRACGAWLSPAETQAPCIPDAVFVSHGHTWCKGVELDHGGDAGIPVEKYLVVQFGDTCPKRHTAMGLNVQHPDDVVLARPPIWGPGRAQGTHRPSRGRTRAWLPAPLQLPARGGYAASFQPGPIKSTHDDARAELGEVRWGRSL